MEGTRLRLTGTGEGFSTTVRTVLSGADSPQRVMDALHHIFPDAVVGELPEEPTFGRASGATWSFDDLSLATFLNQLHEQRILDTALDAMSLNMQEESTTFQIGRRCWKNCLPHTRRPTSWWCLRDHHRRKRPDRLVASGDLAPWAKSSSSPNQ